MLKQPISGERAYILKYKGGITEKMANFNWQYFFLAEPHEKILEIQDLRQYKFLVCIVEFRLGKPAARQTSYLETHNF